VDYHTSRASPTHTTAWVRSLSLGPYTVPQYLRKTSHFWLNLLLASCFAEAGFTLPDKHSASAFLSTG